MKKLESIGKLVGFLTDKITEHITLDLQKKLLSYHKSFNVMELYRKLDSDNKGYVIAADFENVFDEGGEQEQTNYEEVI